MCLAIAQILLISVSFYIIHSMGLWCHIRSLIARWTFSRVCVKIGAMFKLVAEKRDGGAALDVIRKAGKVPAVFIAEKYLRLLFSCLPPRLKRFGKKRGIIRGYS